MFSKQFLMIVGVIFLIAVSIIVLSVTSNRYPHHGLGRVAISVVAPLQEIATHTQRAMEDVWRHYFDLVAVSRENDHLRRAFSERIERENLCREIELANERLRSLLNFQKSIPHRVVAAEVIGKDPSPWFKTVVIDKGRANGLRKGLPVVIAEGIVGQIIDVSAHYAKVLLIIDQNSAVDALVQSTRARGIIQADYTGKCIFQYVLRKHDVSVGATVVSSGLDGVFPKGLRVAKITAIVRRTSGIFQEVSVTPFVDFEKLEEVLVLLNPVQHEFSDAQ